MEVTHYCKVCFAMWQFHADGTCSLRSKACGPCCDNVPMGDQIVALPPTQEGSRTEEQPWDDFFVIERERSPGVPMYWVRPSGLPYDPWKQWGDIHHAMRWHVKQDALDYLERTVDLDARRDATCKVTQHSFISVAYGEVAKAINGDTSIYEHRCAAKMEDGERCERADGHSGPHRDLAD